MLKIICDVYTGIYIVFLFLLITMIVSPRWNRLSQTHHVNSPCNEQPGKPHFT